MAKEYSRRVNIVWRFLMSAAEAAAVGSVVIPPSMIMIIYGSITGVSIGGLFMAGVVPGIMIAVSLMSLTYGMSYLPAYPELRHAVCAAKTTRQPD